MAWLLWFCEKYFTLTDTENKVMVTKRGMRGWEIRGGWDPAHTQHCMSPAGACSCGWGSLQRFVEEPKEKTACMAGLAKSPCWGPGLTQHGRSAVPPKMKTMKIKIKIHSHQPDLPVSSPLLPPPHSSMFSFCFLLPLSWIQKGSCEFLTAVWVPRMKTTTVTALLGKVSDNWNCSEIDAEQDTSFETKSIEIVAQPFRPLNYWDPAAS